MVDFLFSHSYLIAQIFGFSAMTMAIISYQSNKHRTIMILLVLCGLFWCCHFYFLGLMTPIALNFINIIRGLIYSFREKGKLNSPLIPTAFIAVSLVMTVLTYENGWSLLPLAGACFATVANWQTNTKRLRLLTVPVCICWFIYNTVNHTWAGMANEVLCFISICISFYRYDLKNLLEEKQRI